MTSWARREYTEIAELRGPLLVVRGVDGVGWDEFAEIRMGDGQTRHGLVLEADRDLAVVQVLEGTEGMRTTATRVAFSGSPLRIPVGTGWLGRVCDGRGDPLDGGPPCAGDASRSSRASYPETPLGRGSGAAGRRQISRRAADRQEPAPHARGASRQADRHLVAPGHDRQVAGACPGRGRTAVVPREPIAR